MEVVDATVAGVVATMGGAHICQTIRRFYSLQLRLVDPQSGCHQILRFWIFLLLDAFGGRDDEMPTDAGTGAEDVHTGEVVEY